MVPLSCNMLQLFRSTNTYRLYKHFGSRTQRPDLHCPSKPYYRKYRCRPNAESMRRSLWHSAATNHKRYYRYSLSIREIVGSTETLFSKQSTLTWPAKFRFFPKCHGRNYRHPVSLYKPKTTLQSTKICCFNTFYHYGTVHDCFIA